MIIFLFSILWCDVPRLPALQFYSHAEVVYCCGVVICRIQIFLSLAVFISIVDFDFGVIGEIIGGVVRLVITVCGYCTGTESGINSLEITEYYMSIIHIELYESDLLMIFHVIPLSIYVSILFLVM